MKCDIIRRNTIFLAGFLAILLTFSICRTAVSQEKPDESILNTPGDRISLTSLQTSESTYRPLAKDTYSLGPGDVLSVNVQSRSGANYLANPENASKENPTLVTVSPACTIHLPLLGDLKVEGKNVSQIESEIRKGLEKYIKHFTVYVSLEKPRVLFVWISGEAADVGPRTVSRLESASSAVLRSRVNEAGSTRSIEILRGGKKLILDPYRVMVFGDASSDLDLESGDRIYVPPVTRVAEISGEAIRPGRYEMVPLSGARDSFRVRDLLQLAIGPTPTAALDRAEVDRIGANGKKVSIKIDLSSETAAGLDFALQSGDELVIPSVSKFQPIVRMIGEFKGDGVYQRAASSAGKDAAAGVVIQNKSGIYSLKQGQTAGDVITQTGGVTPQADLRKAHILRRESERTVVMPLDLDRLLVKNDRSADIRLQSGDELVLPALEDKVHVFGEVKTPGSYAYSPSRRLIDYLGDAGGPNEKSRLSQVRIVRVMSGSPQVVVLNVSSAIKGKSTEQNPILEAGDLIYVPSKGIGSWQDFSQLIISTYSLSTLVGIR